MKENLKYKELSDGRWVVTDEDYVEKCEACGSTDKVEWHHWAPKYLFGLESVKYPMSKLCRVCHTHWHKVITPRMCDGAINQSQLH